MFYKYNFILKFGIMGNVTKKFSTSVSLKMAERSEAKSAKRSFASKYLIFKIFDAKLIIAIVASLRSAIFSETEVDNLLVTFPARVKICKIICKLNFS